jgi:single-strand DNA-binding protein
MPTASGLPVASFTVGSTPRTYNRDRGEWADGEPLFLRCSLWRQAGENAAQSLSRGTRVIVTGRLRQRTFDDKEGQRRTTVEIDAEEVAVSLAFATAQITKTYRAAQPAATTPAPAPAAADAGRDPHPF